MLNDATLAILESLNLKLDRIDLNSGSKSVAVGITDHRGSRWIGRASFTPHDPCEGLEVAFRDSLRQFNPRWEDCLEKVVPDS